jgi:predicted TIM-barrel fold metal-dependent hydrolase
MVERGAVPGRLKAAEIPAGAVDCHVHVFDPSRFPFAEPRSYTPGSATIGDLRGFLASLKIERAVLVQPSVYGTDNRCLLDGLEQLGPKIARGIAVVDPATVTDNQLRALQRAGVVGVRVNLNTTGERRPAAAVDAVSRIIARVSGLGVIVQVYVDLPMVEALHDTIAASPVPIVLDHFGGAQARAGLTQPGFDALRRLLAAGSIWVKLSAAYRAATTAPHYPDLAPIASELVASNPDRLVWASDWPHTGGGAGRRDRTPSDIEPFRNVDDLATLSLLSSWAGGRDTYRKILVDNAARLFGF